MVEKEHIIGFLRKKGTSSGSPDSDVRAALLKAGWNEEDVDVALKKLRNEPEPYQAATTGHTRNVLYTNMPIASETLSSLLGIGVSLPQAQLRAHERRKAAEGKMPFWASLLVILFSIIVGVGGILLVMYFYNIGPFYTPVENYTF